MYLTCWNCHQQGPRAEVGGLQACNFVPMRRVAAVGARSLAMSMWSTPQADTYSFICALLHTFEFLSGGPTDTKVPGGCNASEGAYGSIIQPEMVKIHRAHSIWAGREPCVRESKFAGHI